VPRNLAPGWALLITGAIACPLSCSGDAQDVAGTGGGVGLAGSAGHGGNVTAGSSGAGGSGPQGRAAPRGPRELEQPDQQWAELRGKVELVEATRMAVIRTPRSTRLPIARMLCRMRRAAAVQRCACQTSSVSNRAVAAPSSASRSTRVARADRAGNTCPTAFGPEAGLAPAACHRRAFRPLPSVSLAPRAATVASIAAAFLSTSASGNRAPEGSAATSPDPT
jgi:hypothetical protein